jgi:hypothetical protein
MIMYLCVLGEATATEISKVQKALRKDGKVWMNDKELIFVVVDHFLRDDVAESEREEAVARLTKQLKKELKSGPKKFTKSAVKRYLKSEKGKTWGK